MSCQWLLAKCGTLGARWNISFCEGKHGELISLFCPSFRVLRGIGSSCSSDLGTVYEEVKNRMGDFP